MFLGRSTLYSAKTPYSHRTFPSTVCWSVCISVCLSVQCIVEKWSIEYGCSLVGRMSPWRRHVVPMGAVHGRVILGVTVGCPIVTSREFGCRDNFLNYFGISCLCQYVILVCYITATITIVMGHTSATSVACYQMADTDYVDFPYL